MLTAQIKDNDVITTGQIKVGDAYPGLCCAGYSWEVAIVFPNVIPAYNSIWGTCQRPDCMGRDGNGTDHYQGVSSWLQEDIEEKLAETQPSRAAGGDASGQAGNGDRALSPLENGIIQAYTELKNDNSVDRVTDEVISTWLNNKSITNQRGEQYTREHINRIKNKLRDEKKLIM